MTVSWLRWSFLTSTLLTSTGLGKAVFRRKDPRSTGEECAEALRYARGQWPLSISRSG
jgi:hypothetical protein